MYSSSRELSPKAGKEALLSWPSSALASGVGGLLPREEPETWETSG